MKKALLILSMFLMTLSYGQEIKQIPQINVSGEGKIKVVPDEATITATVDTRGNNAKEVKRQNDQQIEVVLKLIRKMNLAPTDYKTKRVSLNPVYDYEKKKTTYNATQTIEILLRDLSKYDELMEGLVDGGINKVNNVVFQSSKLEQYQSEARKMAMKDAKQKAIDYVSVLGQKVGKALTISDNSQNYYPQPMYEAMRMTKSDSAEPRETLAVGEINIVANVSVSFVLE
ncbi:SIMPL domain-containing protein [Flavobacterium sp. F-380]|uniref:SIMPL domain-containing protein n=1 Tax=Flavobacterium kayseriense TaxID=2764714 RepID=A0ABR7J827_9FLAO|nr:SIMPL domain-containing protein [Flavobacterium kayseriense]MBC5841636.1 SIMPL domain-containing protein [Flavobacterium kayseriense]MBC5848164.1 SIMPL domain-containing protein [Flavobacterium kayseriense]